MTATTSYIDFDEFRDEVTASYTDAQRQEYDAADSDAEIQIVLAELVYDMRTQAGISQAELAHRMGASQPFISAIERGGRTPTVETLGRIARATGNKLRIVTERA